MIPYLEEGRYVGFDSNSDFVEVSKKQVDDDSGLQGKRPKIELIRDFELDSLGAFEADFALAFSVLNHCSDTQKEAFFSTISSVLKPSARLYITHAEWFSPSYLVGTGLSQLRLIESPQDVSPELAPSNFGWPEARRLRIIELSVV